METFWLALQIAGICVSIGVFIFAIRFADKMLYGSYESKKGKEAKA